MASFRNCSRALAEVWSASDFEVVRPSMGGVSDTYAPPIGEVGELASQKHDIVGVASVPRTDRKLLR